MMKVHLTTSRPSLKSDIELLRKIIDTIHARDHYLAHDWIEMAYKRFIELKQPINDWNYVYKENLEALAKADVIIAETTFENFAVGYQVATAIQQKKPVLLLRKSEADKNAFVTGVEDNWVKQSEYTEKTLAPIVEKFLDENDIQAKDMRFNFFIDRPIYNYLRWAAYKTGKTKAEILRDLVSREIEKETKT